MDTRMRVAELTPAEQRMDGLANVRIARSLRALERRCERGSTWAKRWVGVLQMFQGLRLHALAQARSTQSHLAGHLPCPIPFREMVINCDGTVACGSTARAPLLGAFDVAAKARPLSSVWEGPSYLAMRARMLAGDLSGCAGCQLYRCSGFEPLSNAEQSQGTFEGLGIRQLLIEPTALCNLDCPTVCGKDAPRSSSPASQRKVRFMPMGLFRQIVEGLDRPIEKICFYNYGEPLLHPEFTTMCQLMRKQCPSAVMVTSTNGSRLRESKMRAGLLQSGLDEVIVSVDGARQSSYEVYRRGGRFDDILDGMRLFREERDRLGTSRPTLTWRYILFPWNDSDEEMALAEALARRIGVDRFCFHLSDLPDMASQTYLPGTAAFERIRGQLF